jgi:hypothetical protein
MRVITLNVDGTETSTVVDSPEIREALRTLKKVYAGYEWCKCGDDYTFGRYPGDGECSCGMHKHHVHCGTCGKLSQIG